MSTDSVLLRTAARPSATRRGNAWVVIGVIAAVLTIGWGAYNLITLLAHAERNEHRVIPADGIRTLRVSTDNGGITITSGPAGSDIVVDAHLSEGLHAPTNTIDIVDGQATLRAQCSVWSQYWCAVSYRIQVPAGIELNLTTEEGNISINGASASLTVRTDSGTVQASNLTSTVVDSRTDVGRTRLEFVQAPTQVSARTDIGSVTIIVPDDETAYNVTMTNDIGSRSNSVRTDSTSTRTINARADVGEITVRYP